MCLFTTRGHEDPTSAHSFLWLGEGSRTDPDMMWLHGASATRDVLAALPKLEPSYQKQLFSLLWFCTSCVL